MSLSINNLDSCVFSGSDGTPRLPIYNHNSKVYLALLVCTPVRIIGEILETSK